VEHAVTGLEFQGVELARQGERLAVVESPVLVQSDEDVLVKVPGVRVVGRAVTSAEPVGEEDLPRAGPDELLSGDSRKGTH
jgi:hypothetical protein